MDLRSQNISALEKDVLDTLIIGGGINGAVSAAALSAHGARTGLIDARDFAGFTSQHSSNLVWGGIKYMEGYEFGLVSGLCRSRNQLLDSFPSTVKEIRFLMTINREFRFHPLIILASTWLYWLLGRCRTRIPRYLSADRIKTAEPLVDLSKSCAGIEYSDAFLHDNDARFVFNFVRNAMNHGCSAANYVEATRASRDDSDLWQIDAVDKETGRSFRIRSKTLINATGAYVDQQNETSGVETNHCHRLSKGIHLLVPKISENHRVLAFFADDERLFFAIPMANRTCIGTTDTPVEKPETEVTEQDRAFVLSNINARLKLDPPLQPSDVIAERCGVRPLAVNKNQTGRSDVMHLSRKHVIETDSSKNHISIFGGKLTDCINVGEEICERIAQLGVALKAIDEPWYGEPGEQERAAFFNRARDLGIDQVIANDTNETLSERLWRRYGNSALAMLDKIDKDPAQLETLVEGIGIRRCELDYQAESEMIVTLEDYMRRRSKVELLQTRDSLRQSTGLMEICERLFGEQAQQKFDEYFKE
ncbi:MAG: FAD-dependent oxidoreductase [Pseudomonadota bacterium]